ncbi:MAG: hypothetical protein IJ153_05410 [Clostridia bacterium]|nr:hypothetical protein [Clostridia bacterium]
MKYFIGIDPGKSGAIAVITEERKILELATFSKEAYLKIIGLYSRLDCVCCLEHVASMPGQGVASTFCFGENFGWIQGALEANGCSYQLVRPRVWKKDFSLNDSKQLSTEACRRLFPDVGDRLHKTPKSKKDDDGLAEALLMAEYARRRL